jgi:hypothetical protein
VSVNPAPPPQYPPPQYPPAPAGQFTPPPVGSFGYAPAPPPQPSGEAIAALICGVMAISCFPLGFVAVFLGARARRAARENPTRVGGEQLALVGMIIGGIIGTLYTLFVLAYVVMVVFAIGLAATTSP